VYRYLVVTPEMQRPLGLRRLRWEDDIRIDFQGIGVRGVNWMVVIQDKEKYLDVVKMVMKCWVP